jgi:transposase
MSKLAELAYDIEQLYIEGLSPKAIATQLECPLSIVYDWLEEVGMGGPEDDVVEEPQDEIYSPYYGA